MYSSKGRTLRDREKKNGTIPNKEKKKMKEVLVAARPTTTIHCSLKTYTLRLKKKRSRRRRRFSPPGGGSRVGAPFALGVEGGWKKTEKSVRGEKDYLKKGCVLSKNKQNTDEGVRKEYTP